MFCSWILALDMGSFWVFSFPLLAMLPTLLATLLAGSDTAAGARRRSAFSLLQHRAEDDAPTTLKLAVVALVISGHKARMTRASRLSRSRERGGRRRGQCVTCD